MFDFGFWELTLVMVVVLLVVGPERLPRLAGQAGKWIGKAKRTFEAFRADIESEIRAAELKEILDKQQSEIGELKEILKGTQKEIEQELDPDDDPLIKAVEDQIESSRETQVSSGSEKNETD